MLDTLRECELEVERARQKLSGDLAVLRAPETFSAFTEDLKQDAMETKDELVAQAKHAVESRVSGLVEEVKARAAANPAAALMIGAGIGWHLLRHPPITSLLVGCGLFSLWRTSATPDPYARTEDYVRRGQDRLKEQAADFATQGVSAARELAAEAKDKIAEKTSEFVDAAKDSATRLSHDARDQLAAGVTSARDGVSAIREKVDSMISNATGGFQSAGGATSARGPAGLDEFAKSASAATAVLDDAESRDRVLLGVAGLAMAAALGIACQRRLSGGDD